MMERRRMARWMIDIAVYAIVLIAWQKVDTAVPKTQQSFVCGDKRLSLPFKKSTVRGIWLHYYFYGTPILIFLIEFILERKSSVQSKLLKSLKRSIRWFKYYFICFICLVIVSSTIKNLYGSLRPYFFEVCKPDKAQNCTEGTIIVDYKCTNTEFSEYVLSESQRSFPSGHTYSVVFTSVFLMLYIQSRFHELPSKLLVVFIYAVTILWTCFVGITRLSDNWHHPIDVIGASIITLPFVFYSSHVLCKNFNRNEED